MTKEYKINLPNPNGISMSIDEFPRTLLGKVMYDIHFFVGLGCSGKTAYKKALKAFAEQIIEEVKENKF